MYNDDFDKKLLEWVRSQIKNEEDPFSFEKKKRQQYYNENKKSILEYNKKYFQKNKQKLSKDRTHKYKTDPQYKISEILRKRVRIALKGKSKPGSAVKDLGCTIDELKIYIENQFREGMTWGNHGVKGWHIDHIKPLSSFNLEDPEQFKEACHYKNLQPLWATENLSKGKKINYY
jgi:hypothetical protein